MFRHGYTNNNRFDNQPLLQPVRAPLTDEERKTADNLVRIREDARIKREEEAEEKKKMGCGRFGRVYKRQIIVNLVSVIFVTGWIILICVYPL